MAPEEFRRRIKQSEADFAAGKHVSSNELFAAYLAKFDHEHNEISLEEHLPKIMKEDKKCFHDSRNNGFTVTHKR